jgi:hypothetical protein
MKSEDNAGNSRNGNTNADNSETGAHTNTIEVGSVGIEGGSDNGASTLRVLKKKHANDSPAKKATRRPFL